MNKLRFIQCIYNISSKTLKPKDDLHPDTTNAWQEESCWNILFDLNN